jgi:hypothetical protein
MTSPMPRFTWMTATLPSVLEVTCSLTLEDTLLAAPWVTISAF